MFQQLFSNCCFVCVFLNMYKTDGLFVKRDSIKLCIFALLQESKHYFQMYCNLLIHDSKLFIFYDLVSSKSEEYI